MTNQCYNSLTIQGLSTEEQQTIKTTITDDISVMEMLDEPTNKEGEVYLSFLTRWEPHIDEIRSLSTKYPSGTFVMTFEEQNEDFFGALVSKNGIQFHMGISERISITGTKYGWVKANHPELISGFDNDDDIEEYLLCEFQECDEFLAWDDFYQNIKNEMIEKSLEAVNNQPVAA